MTHAERVARQIANVRAKVLAAGIKSTSRTECFPQPSQDRPEPTTYTRNSQFLPYWVELFDEKRGFEAIDPVRPRNLGK